MTTWVGQYCIYVTDLETTVAFYKTLGLEVSTRTDLGHTVEAVIANDDKGGRLQLAQKLDAEGPIDHGNAFWKLYVATNDIVKMYKDAIDAGYSSVAAPFRPEQWPMTIAFLEDPDGYQVELTQRHPWRDGDATTYAWFNQYCIYVSDLERSVAFYESLGLECTSRTDIPHAKEAIVENTGKGGKIQLAQKLDDVKPIDMGTAMWKLYLLTDDCKGLYATAMEHGYTSVLEPMDPDRWPVTLAFIEDADGYQIELVEKHA